MPSSPTPEEITALARAAVEARKLRGKNEQDWLNFEYLVDPVDGFYVADIYFIAAATPEAWIAQADRIRELEAELRAALGELAYTKEPSDEL